MNQDMEMVKGFQKEVEFIFGKPEIMRTKSELFWIDRLSHKLKVAPEHQAIMVALATYRLLGHTRDH